MLILGVGFVLAAVLLMAKKAEGATSTMKPLEPIPVREVETIDGLISYVAAKYKVSASLVKAVAMTESSLNPNATNPSDPSYGLMAIQPILAEDFGTVKEWQHPTEAELSMLMDPLTNLSIGAWQLHRLTSKYPLDTAIQMYNVGETGYNVKGYRNSKYLATVKSYLVKFGG